MGSVELVMKQDGPFRRAYARKRLRPGYVADPDMRRMFMEEARVAGLLHHANVVSVIDVGEDADGPFLVMDYVHGVALHELIKAMAHRGRRLPVQLVVRVFREVALGLHSAHELRDHRGELLGLVHRDVSPQNIMIGFDGVARLTDFGIAKALHSTEQTNTGVLKGKMGYFAPEQLRFHPATRSSDLFALGVTMFEALAARRLYKRATQAESAEAILDEPPPDLYDVRRDLPPRLQELLLELLAKDPEVRPRSAQEVAMRLEEVLTDLLLEEEPCDVAELVNAHFGDRSRPLVLEAPPQPTRSRWAIAAALVVAVGAAVFASLAVIGDEAARAESAPAHGVARQPTPPVTATEEAPERSEMPESAPRTEEPEETPRVPPEPVEPRPVEPRPVAPAEREAETRTGHRLRRLRRAESPDAPAAETKEAPAQSEAIPTPPEDPEAMDWSGPE